MSAHPSAVPDRLPPAQDRVLHKIANGLDMEATALALNITRGTVSVQVSSTSRRLGVSGRAALTVLRDSAFSDVTETVIPVRRTWSIEYAAGDVLTEDNAFTVLTALRHSSLEGR
ncbi:LuxR C-terminal-related transcriptional regulator [Streptomyces sp. NPDC047043]|uniref:LuxR C-terminal-related transcriptional regulator n=1 Tax=Streptomyces sp. NPDC047043 TaxID=3154497 RepID=UPI0033DDC46D